MELLQTPSGSLAASLVHDFFTCLGLDFSLAVFGPESNLGAKLWDLHTRECLLKATGLGKDAEPMTPILLTLCYQCLNTSTAPVTSHAHMLNGKSMNQKGRIPPLVAANGTPSSRNGITNHVSQFPQDRRKLIDAPSTSGVNKIDSAPTTTNTSSATKQTPSVTTTVNDSSNTSVPSKVNNKSNSSTVNRKEVSSSNKNILKQNPVPPPGDILSAAPPDADSSEASSLSDVEGLRKDHTGNKPPTEAGTKADKTADCTKHLSDGDYEDDFSESSSSTVEESSSSWGHPPLPPSQPINKTEKTNVLEKKSLPASDVTSSEKTGSLGKTLDKESNNSTTRKRSLDILDDEVLIDDFISSESSSARDDTEDIADSKTTDVELDYQEPV
ncbi:centrosomal protein 43 [Hyalella azteca]|uniref:Centrosomal protein 43 n=1 Tax=Hyalella azteca TaxID=294128 RepID=A0A8B7PB02_HYAAZ|nr:centrosomal protein 43 [Hyalella azteca]